MGLIHKTKFIPFVGVNSSWVQIKKSTTFSLGFNPQTKTFDFISSENPEEEIDSYQPSLSQSLTMFDDEPDFDVIFDMAYHLPTGGDAHKDVLLVFYASKHEVDTYELSEDNEVDETKTYYTRTGTAGAYVYTPVAEPTGDPSALNYYELTSSTTYYKAWKVDSVVKLGTLDSVNESIDFDLALNKRLEGAVTIVINGSGDKVPTWVAGTWNGDEFTPAA